MLTHLTDEQRALMPAYARQWADRLLSTDSAPREEVEDAYRRCYEAAGIPWHGRVVWVSSPIVGALAAPIAAHMHGAVGGAVDGAVHGAVDGAVDVAVHDAVHGAVHGAVDVAVDGGWYRYVGGGWWGSWAAWRGFILDHTAAEVPQHIRDLHATWTATCDAGWWWPHRDWVIACDRPSVALRHRPGDRLAGRVGAALLARHPTSSASSPTRPVCLYIGASV